MIHRFIYTVSLIIMILLFSPVHAFLPPEENGMSYSVGAGALYTPVYTGSDEYETKPVPLADVRFTHDDLQAFVSIMDGIGVSYFSNATGISAQGSINLGTPRSPDDQDILEDTPEIKNPLYGTLGVEWWFSPFLGLSTAVGYHPLTADFSGEKDENYNGFLITPSISYSIPILPRLMMGGNVELSLMNDGYAQAYFGNKYSSEELDPYEAKGGFHDISASLSFFYLFNAHFTPVLLLEGSYLLGDAQDSPLTQDKASGTVALMCMYRF